jgi:bacterioferritin
MKSEFKIIEALNEVLAGELTAINQYFLHGRMCKNWGYTKLGETIYTHSIGEMKHASEITDRILFLEGLPNLQKLGKLNIGETVIEQLESDLKLEEDALVRLRRAIAICTEFSDYATRDLLDKILTDEEQHVDWIETQLHLAKTVGLENYLAHQMA